MKQYGNISCKWLLCAGLLISLHTGIFSADLEFDPIYPEVVSADLIGMGGAYTALERGFDTLFTNPAALAYVKNEWSVARLAASLSGPLLELPSSFSSDDISSSLFDLANKNDGLYAGANLSGPIAFGKVDKNFGFGVFNQTVSCTDVSSDGFALELAGEELLLLGGYGLPIYEKGPHSLAIGIQLKGFFQIFDYEIGTVLSFFNDLTDFAYDSYPVIFSTGFGLDAGLLYKFGENLNIGLTCRNIYTPVFSTDYENLSAYFDNTPNTTTEYDSLNRDISAGVVYSIPLPSQWLTISDVRVMADYRDILSFYYYPHKNPVLNLAAGTEIVLFDVLSIRAGLNEVCPAFGLGIDFSVCKLDLALSGSELGSQPGDDRIWNLAASFSFEY